MNAIKIGAIDFFNRNISQEELALRLSNKMKSFLQGSTSMDIGNLRLDTFSFSVFVDNKLIDQETKYFLNKME